MIWHRKLRWAEVHWRRSIDTVLRDVISHCESGIESSKYELAD